MNIQALTNVIEALPDDEDIDGGPVPQINPSLSLSPFLCIHVFITLSIL